MKSYEEKLAELKAAHARELKQAELQNHVQAQFPEIVTKVYIHHWRKKDEIHVKFEATSKDQAKEILKTWKPTNTDSDVSGATRDQVLESPYRIDLHNPAQSGMTEYSRFKVSISYQYHEYRVTIDLPIEVIEDFVYPHRRKITSSEYHYFTGTSMQKLQAMEVNCYIFKNSNVIDWYGGNKTQLDLDYINEIINYLQDK